jgi:hypothetical protein
MSSMIFKLPSVASTQNTASPAMSHQSRQSSVSWSLIALMYQKRSCEARQLCTGQLYKGPLHHKTAHLPGNAFCECLHRQLVQPGSFHNRTVHTCHWMPCQGGSPVQVVDVIFSFISAGIRSVR